MIVQGNAEREVFPMELLRILFLEKRLNRYIQGPLQTPFQRASLGHSRALKTENREKFLMLFYCLMRNEQI